MKRMRMRGIEEKKQRRDRQRMKRIRVVRKVEERKQRRDRERMKRMRMQVKRKRFNAETKVECKVFESYRGKLER